MQFCSIIRLFLAQHPAILDVGFRRPFVFKAQSKHSPSCIPINCLPRGIAAVSIEIVYLGGVQLPNSWPGRCELICGNAGWGPSGGLLLGSQNIS